MNDPNKRINVNKSSLLSLKAELLRKQAEVNRAKISHSIDNFVPKKMANANKMENIINEPINSTTKTEDFEDSKLLTKSKTVLEAKSKLYDKLLASGGSLNSDDNCLVMFNQKKQDCTPNNQYKSSSSSSESEDNADNYVSQNPEEQWVEYTDCLGRTRKCLKKDLDFFKQKDNALADNLHEEKNDSPKWVVDTEGTPQNKINNDEDNEINPESEIIIIGAKHQQMKEQWEKQEMENVHKDFIHYQDILYDEARSHGVGYYEFSTNEQERQEQIKELEKIREGTLTAQKLREDQRLKREKLIADRVRAAKNRQRARMGLPPEEEKEEEPEAEPSAATVETSDENEKKLKLLELENQKKEEERQRYIRPWDKGKSGVPSSSHRNKKHNRSDSEDDSEEEWKYKIERAPMTQEQWVAKKRDDRISEFAPIDLNSIELPKTQKQTNFTSKGHAISQMEMDDLPTEHHTLFFTSKKKFIPKNTLATKIQNELSDDDTDNPTKESLTSRKRAEIPPPPTMEYYGPSSSAHKIRKYDKIDKTTLEQSIEAGLKFVRDQVDKGQIGTKSKWAANTDY